MSLIFNARTNTILSSGSPSIVIDGGVNEANVGLTADVGSAQGNGVITAFYNVYSTVANTGDAATLQASFAAGTVVYIKNDGANSMDVFPASGDDAGAGTNTAVAIPNGESKTFIATTTDATWTELIIGGAGGSGTVTSSGSPLDNQVAVFTTGTDIDSSSSLTFVGSTLTTTTLAITNIDNSSAINITGMDENDDGIILQDGMSMSWNDRASANRIYCQNIGVGGGSGEINWVSTSSGLMSINFPLDMKDNQIRNAVLEETAWEASTGSLSSNVATLAWTASAAWTLDLAAASLDVTINITGGPPAGTFGQCWVRVTQDTVTRTITWQGDGGDAMDWPGGGTQPVLSTGSGDIDIFEFVTWDSGTTWYGRRYGADFL